MAKFETELTRLGLRDKEAAVYLACLQLGSSPVQQIARKAKVVRATAYVVLESLMKQGLVTKFQEGKKTLFSAEPPRQLMRLLEKQREEIEDKQESLENMLPELQVLMKQQGTPTVRYFEGREGLYAIRQEILMYSESGDTIYNFSPMDHLDAVFPREMDTYNKQRVAKGIISKTIFTTKSATLRGVLEGTPANDRSQRVWVSPTLFKSSSGITIFRDRIAIGSFTGRLLGVVIESAPLTDMMKEIFELAWAGAVHVSDTKAVL